MKACRICFSEWFGCFMFQEPHFKKQRRPLARVPSIQSLANIVRDTPLQTAKRRLKVSA